MATHTTIKSFDAALGRYAKERVPAIQRGRLTVIALEGARQLTQLTPVDTGRAKGNWQMTLGRPASGEIERLDRSPKGSAGVALQGETMHRLKDWKPGQWVWYHNGVPYITVLNDGTDSRVAHMMLERTVEHLKAWLRLS